MLVKCYISQHWQNKNKMPILVKRDPTLVKQDNNYTNIGTEETNIGKQICQYWYR